MSNLPGGVVVVVEADRVVTYAAVESALQAEGILSDYLIDRSEHNGGTELTISVHLPASQITADGVPDFPAVQTLQQLTNALRAVEAGSRGIS